MPIFRDHHRSMLVIGGTGLLAAPPHTDCSTVAQLRAPVSGFGAAMLRALRYPAVPPMGSNFTKERNGHMPDLIKDKFDLTLEAEYPWTRLHITSLMLLTTFA
ncbi:hypothetical protein DFH28DRAFT_938510 [Melampsora americana]|nr:hypothetical protein DFH28DRAFT_939954 [Melampsora americana]KAH9807471.1 hypothetical protein DFH28DRAFT_938510 [Melampsora americana]